MPPAISTDKFQFVYFGALVFSGGDSIKDKIFTAASAETSDCHGSSRSESEELDSDSDATDKSVDTKSPEERLNLELEVTPNELYDHVTKRIHAAAHEALRLRDNKENYSNEISEKIKELIEIKKKKYIEWLTNKTNYTRSEYIKWGQLVKQRMKEEENKKWQKSLKRKKDQDDNTESGSNDGDEDGSNHQIQSLLWNKGLVILHWDI
ncbi:hypothetical protein FQA39_LY06052 [Lamprigera yunnana]|nr:hypothetical protein FQA39_LY06052 [Lamprigera yunnana]